MRRQNQTYNPDCDPYQDDSQAELDRIDRPPTPEPAESEGKWKPTEEMIARNIAFHGECFAVDYGNAHDYDDAFAEKMREREKWYKAGWQGRKRYEAEQGGNDE